MKHEIVAVTIYRSLTDAGYIIEQKGDRWNIMEPQTVDFPQKAMGFETLGECEAWSRGVEIIRFITGNRFKST